jgi:hypothetical protein
MMLVDAPIFFVDGFSLGFLMGFLTMILMSGLFCGYWLALHPASASQPKMKSMAASASH